MIKEEVSQSKRAFYFKSLDGLRGIAFLFVLISHISIEFQWATRGIGKIGVWIFFILSFFLLTYTIIATPPDKIKRVTYWFNFFLRRILRIYPLFALTILVYYLTDRITQQSAINHLKLEEGILHLWAIPVEVKAYALLPLIGIMLYLLKRKTYLGIIYSICLITLHLLIFPTTQMEENSMVFYKYLAIFGMGSFTSFMVYQFKDRNFNTLKYVLILLSYLSAIGIILLSRPILILLKEDLPSRYAIDYSWVFGILTSLLILSMLLSNGGLVKHILETKVVVFVGKVSYPAYLFHYLVIDEVKINFGNESNYVQAALMTLGTFVVATIAHIIIEKNLIKIHIKV